MLILYMVTLNASGPKMLSLETASKQAGVAAGVVRGEGSTLPLVRVSAGSRAIILLFSLESKGSNSEGDQLR